MQRVNKAKEMKEDKQKLEDQLFKRNLNWKPKLTTPQEPKLSAYLNKQDRDVNVKSLNKPVNVYQENKQSYIEKGSKNSYGDENGGSP